MTAIAGLVENGVVWIGGDSAGVGGYSMQVRSDPKVFRNGEFLIGYTTSFRMGQILEHHLSPPTPHEGDAGMDYMVKRFIPAVKSAFKSNAFQRSFDGRDYGGEFLVGYRSELYVIESDYQVARVCQQYYACGCGMDLVLGSLHTTDQYEMPPRERIELALSAAAEFSAGVCEPFHIFCTEKASD